MIELGEGERICAAAAAAVDGRGQAGREGAAADAPPVAERGVRQARGGSDADDAAVRGRGQAAAVVEGGRPRSSREPRRRGRAEEREAPPAFEGAPRATRRENAREYIKGLRRKSFIISKSYPPYH